jgi:subtilisin family serine protease
MVGNMKNIFSCKNWRTTLLKAGAGCLSLVALSSFAQNARFVPGQILVKPKTGVSETQLGQLVAGYRGHVANVLTQLNVRVIQLPENAADQAVAALSNNPQIEFAERDFIAQAVLTPNDTYYAGYQWHLPKISAPQAWDISTGKTNPIIAVVDTGVYAAHPDLAGKILNGYNYVNNTANTADDYGHGTEVSGTAAAYGNNSVGVAGVTFANYILPVKVLDSTGSGTYSAIANGITYAADHGARVINMSLGGTSSSSTLQSAINYAWNKNCVLIAAAGNGGNNVLNYPAACQNVVAVSATDQNDALAYFSSYGSDVALAAPGVSIATTTMDGGYGSVSGTSFSSPIVSGVVALMASVNPQLSNTQLVNMVKTNVDDLGAAGYDQYFGYGRVNAYKALVAVTNTLTSPTNTNTTTNTTVTTPDTTAPTVAITSPGNNSYVVRNEKISVNATDNVQVTKVELYIDGKFYTSSTSASVVFTWNTNKAARGSHTLQAVAYDAAGNVGASAMVTVLK